jgi:hypothetical protein
VSRGIIFARQRVENDDHPGSTVCEYSAVRWRNHPVDHLVTGAIPVFQQILNVINPQAGNGIASAGHLGESKLHVTPRMTAVVPHQDLNSPDIVALVHLT